MAKPTKYQVTAPYVMLTTGTAQGPMKTGFYRDALVPPDALEQEVAAHLESGLIAEAGVWDHLPDTETAPPAPASDPAHYVPESDAAASRPRREDPKHMWVSWAVHTTRGTPEPLDRETASALSKQELIERFGG